LCRQNNAAKVKSELTRQLRRGKRDAWMIDNEPDADGSGDGSGDNSGDGSGMNEDDDDGDYI